jgi:Fic family protein
MACLFKELATWDHDHPVRRTARFHGRLAATHPFVDGNRRTARLAANLLLLRAVPHCHYLARRSGRLSGTGAAIAMSARDGPHELGMNLSTTLLRTAQVEGCMS